MSLARFAVSSSRRVFPLALVLILAVGALASGIGIVFQGFETDISQWFNADVAQQVFQEPSGYTNGGYASGIASATGNYHARLVVDPSQCLNDGGGTPPPNNDCYGPNTYWNEIRESDGATTSGSNIITSATANFTAADVGLGVYVRNPITNDLVFSPGTTVTSVTNSTTAVVSTNAIESSANATLRVFSLFSLGYITQVDIYLDVAWAAGNSDWRFDWDTAIRDNALNFDSDYAFNVGTQLAGDATPGFWVGTSTNAGRGNTYPENQCPSPIPDGIGNYCRAPFKITTSGWYTFRHIYRIDPSTQNLSIEFQVLPQGGSPVVDQTIYGWQGVAQAPAGGIMPAYGWFVNQEIPELAMDNSLLKDFDTLSLTPTNPSPLGSGTIQTFILSATFGGTPDPLTPGLTPANVTFTQGNTDTGSVTVVPSGTQPNNGTFSFDATGGAIGSVNLTANIDTFASNTASFNVIAPALYSPVNGSILPGSTVTFYWTEYPGATAYWLDVGPTPGSNTYAQSGSLSSSTLSYTVNGLPTDGSAVYATWYYYVSGSWQHSEYNYTAYTAGSPKGVITSPPPNSTLSGSTVNFTWTLGVGATNYWIDAGSSAGGNQYFQSGPLGNVNNATVSGLPTNGSLVYVTLFSYVGGQWLYNEYTYTAYTLVVGPPPVSFLAAVDYAAGGGPDSVAVGDFNGDGKADLAVANYGDGTVSVLLGNGNGTFQAPVNYPVGSAAALVVVADLNGDGKLDLAVANANGVGVLLGNGDGTFQPVVNYPAGSSPYWVAVADLNGDGKLDLAVADGGGGVSVLLGNGDGTFQAAVNYGAGATPYSVVVGDFNGDGKPDLAVANYGDGTVSVLLGNGNGTFQAAVNYNVGTGPYAIAVGDFNGDGKLDLATANYTSGNVSVLIGNGNGTFQPAVSYTAGAGANSVSVRDLNDDGKPDLVVANRTSNNVSVLLGNGDGTFQPPVNFGVGAGPAGSAIGDFDGNGKPDIATANYFGNSVSILLSNTSFAGPAIVYSPPPNSTLTGPSVTFQWTASDSATAYWIDVGSVAGGNQYYQSGSLPTTTFAATVNGLPVDGSTVYVTMYSLIGGQWVHNSYTYTAHTASGKGVITIPLPYSTLTGSTVTFQWTAGAGATAYWLDAGSVQGGNQYYQSGNLGNVLTTTATGLPTDGSLVYVTLYSYVGGQWLNNQYIYTAATGSGSLGVMLTPVPGSTLSGPSATFTWSAGAGATAYWMDAGSVSGGHEYYQSGNLGNVLTTTVNTLPQNNTTVYVTLYSYVGGQWLYNQYTYNSSMAFQGFETGTGDWADVTGTPGAGIAQVASGGGVLGVPSASGSYHAEITNEYDTYMTGYGFGEYSFFGYVTQPPYPGNFSQSVSVYIFANWPVASPNNNGQGFWLDMQPGNPDPNNSGAEHNFRFTPSGTAVAVSVDGQGSPIATITTSGWYNFQMTYQKGALPTDWVTTNMNIFDPNGNLIGTTQVLSNSPSTDGPLLSQDLEGPGYVWITVWADGWPAAGASDVLALDNARADLL